MTKWTATLYLLITASLATLAPNAIAEHAAFKLYADVYETQADVQSVLQNEQLAIVQEARSTVPCEANTPFGVLYILQKGDTGRAKLVERWHHPHVSIRKKQYTDRNVDLRFGQAFSEPKFSGYELLPPLRIDGEFRLEILEDGVPILSHAFVVDCPNSEQGDEIVCEDEHSTGTRLKQLVCKSTDEIRREHDEARRNIRISDGS